VGCSTKHGQNTTCRLQASALPGGDGCSSHCRIGLPCSTAFERASERASRPDAGVASSPLGHAVASAALDAGGVWSPLDEAAPPCSTSW
jgi:hypothetical protein